MSNAGRRGAFGGALLVDLVFVITLVLDSKRVRPKESEVKLLKTSNQKAKKILNWKPKTNLKKMIEIMLDFEKSNENSK